LQERRVEITDNEQAYRLFGRHDRHLKAIESSFAVQTFLEDGQLLIRGAARDVDKAASLIERLKELTVDGRVLTSQEVRYAIDLARTGEVDKLLGLSSDVLLVTARGKEIKPKTLGQKKYVEAMRRDSLVFCIGPAGTGKTYLAMAMAISLFKAKEVNRIILTRPAVEAGEKLGFLPGDLQEKVDPYLRPLYDALFDMLNVQTFERYMAKGLIEVAPLAYMRGRTLDDSFVILDEAQNTTPEQMKMFLTRLGFGARAVVTGDVTQVDLPAGTYSGLQQVTEILRDIDGISFVYLTDRDVVRHELVQKIIRAYEQWEAERREETAPGED